MYRGNETGILWADYAKLSVIGASNLLDADESVATAGTFVVDEATVAASSVGSDQRIDTGLTSSISSKNSLFRVQSEVVPEIQMGK
jgi:hypothetical protein